MDDIVKQAMAKWPNVPDCYGWLALDARGAWRMRDERAQQLNLPGDKVHQAALLAFINRNYAADARGCWYFQNGPQRVFVNLEATPFIARTDPVAGLLLQTGARFVPTAAWMTQQGELILQADGVVAQVDDRDLGQLLAQLQIDGAAASDEALLAWLEDDKGAASLQLGERRLAVGSIASDAVPAQFGFTPLPRPA